MQHLLLELLLGSTCRCHPSSAVFAGRRCGELHLIHTSLCLTDIHELILNSLRIAFEREGAIIDRLSASGRRHMQPDTGSRWPQYNQR